ncbi:MAG: hypothetical protein M3305_10470 [Actinomycetota bacterium]|nr:hypothetical protein [Actinomycetota bacterium]
MSTFSLKNGDAVDVRSDSEVIVTVFDPVPEQIGYMREGLVAFAFLAMSVNRGLLWALLGSKCAAFSMEMARDDKGDLSILEPIRQIAGSLVPQIGAHYLQCCPRRGVLLAVRLGILWDA